jgi:hypothetical protein
VKAIPLLARGFGATLTWLVLACAAPDSVEPAAPALTGAVSARTRCKLARAIVVRGTFTTQFRRDSVPAGTVFDARDAIWRWPPGKGAAVRIKGGADICWDRGQVLGTADQQTTSWSTYHSTHAYEMISGPRFIVQNVYAENVGDGIRWGAGANGWTARSVHLKDIHDDCVETDYMRSGTLEDALFEGCFVFFADRPNPNVGTGYDNPDGLVTIRRVIAWMKPTPTVPPGYTANTTGSIWKTDLEGNPPRSPRKYIVGSVLRVGMGSAQGGAACLNRRGLVTAEQDTVVWEGPGPYPCLPLPPGWTLTTDMSVWDRAVQAWKDSHPDGP